MSEIETAFITKALISAGFLFVIGYFGNVLAFSGRIVNALVTAIIFGLIIGAVFYFADPALLSAEGVTASRNVLLQQVAVAAGLVFVIDLIANMLVFNNRFTNALMTSVVFLVVFIGLFYASGGVAQMPAAS